MTKFADILHLSPTERLVLEQGRQICEEQRSPFSYRDLPELKHGTVRNIFQVLRRYGLIELYDRSSLAFYWVKGVPRPATSMTRPPVVVPADLQRLLDGIRLGDRCVHDIRLFCQAPGLYDSLRPGTFTLREASRDAALPAVVSEMRSARVTVHRTDSVSTLVGCSPDPVPLSLEGYTELCSLLGAARQEIIRARARKIRVPEISTWLVQHWHYGRDGMSEVGGPRFCTTFSGFGEAILRAYTKRLRGRDTMRIELEESPRKPLPNAFFDRLNGPG